MKEPTTLISRLTIIYFVFVFIEVIAEYYMYQPLMLIFNPFIPIILILLYWLSSSQRQMLFIVSLFFLLMNLDNKEVLVNQVGCYGVNLGRIDFYLDNDKSKSSIGKSIIV